MFTTSHSSPSVRIRRSAMLVAVGLLGLAVQPVDPTAAAQSDQTPVRAARGATLATDTADEREVAANRTQSVVALSQARLAQPLAPPTRVDGPAVATATAERVTPASDPFSPISSPDVGDHCAASLSADDLTAFFSEPIGSLQGSDYQRALRLADDRVLWTFQDAFISGTLVHNVAMIQSGRCFTVLNRGPQSWLFADQTVHMSRWHWILDGTQDPDGTIQLFVAEMHERSGGYLERTTPVALHRVALDPTTLTVTDVAAEAQTGVDLYGWSITSDEVYTYLYSHCYRQFGFDGSLGGDSCAEHVKVARVRGAVDGPREYWSLDGWVTDSNRAHPVVDGAFVGSGNNPAQIRFDGNRFVLVEKRDDWWGTTVEFGVSDNPQGPFRTVASIEETLKCAQWVCNTYFAAWVPWRDTSGALIWSIGHNRWNGAETVSHLDVYRPTFHTIAL